MEIDLIEAIYSLSSLQQGILFHALNSPASQAYLVQTAYELSGPLQVEYLEQAWQETVARHPILRTAFVWEEVEQPVQVVCSEVPLALVEADWRAACSAEQQARLEQFLQTDREQGFDLAQAPLLRLHLFRLDEQRYYLVWTMHHLILDGWSVSLVFNEVLDRYAYLCQEYQSLWLPPAPAYRDYIAWLGQQDMGQAQTFWQTKLAGFEAATPLGLDLPRSATNSTAQVSQESEYGEGQIYLSEEISRELRNLCKRHHLTLNTVLQGAWAVLLSRYSGEQDVVFGSVVAGRSPELAGVEEMVGLFINTLPVRIKLDPQAKVIEWLKELQGNQLELSQYEYSPLVAVQGWSEVAKGQPLFESLYIFENYLDKGYEAAEEAGLTVRDIASHERTNYPLTVAVTPAERLHIHLNYQKERFTEAAIEQMLSHWQVVVESIVAKAEQNLSELEILSIGERQQLLNEFSAPVAALDSDLIFGTIHKLFEEQAEKTPETIALEFEGEQLSYTELNRRANRLAHFLQTQGVERDQLVGVCLERNTELVVALLAILKAGGAYVPLDPAYPQERLDFMLADCQARLVISQAATLARVGWSEQTQQAQETNRQYVLLEGEWFAQLCQPAGETKTAEADNNPQSGTNAGNLAYMIYTSGSTGKPKGVLVEHRGMVNLLRSNRARFGFGQTEQPETFPCLASFAFDIFGFELYNPLVNGGKALLVGRDHLLDMPRLLTSLQNVELLHTVPSLMRQLLTSWQGLSHTAREFYQWENLRSIFIGGDAVNTELLEEMRRVFRYSQIHVLYGPTEATIICTSYAVPSLKQQSELSPAKIIGSGLAGAQLLVLDRWQNLAPLGVNGELYIGGSGLARCYHQRPELTSEKFVELNGQRYYRSGDQVRWLADGQLEFVGRVDNQVKIRGYRIEPGEVETVLAKQAGIAECVVIVREDQPGEKRLVAYLVAEAGQLISRSELRQKLGAVLPDYMIPSSFVVLEQLPLNANGKLDRKALPLPGYEHQTEAQLNYHAPRTPVEKTLVDIWAEVLNVPQVGIYDNFFELGGDSILTIQIVARASQAGLRFTPKQLFEHPSVMQLAGLLVTNYIAAQANPATAQTENAPENAVLEGEVLLTPIQRWFFEQDWTHPHQFNMSTLLDLQMPLEAERLESSLAKLLNQHDALRLSFSQQAGANWQACYRPVEPTVIQKIVSYHDLSKLDKLEQTRRLQEIAASIQSSFELAEGNLIRLAYFDCGQEQAPKLLIVVHHLVMDSVSWPILLQDLTNFYLNENAPAPAKTTSLQNWAQRLYAYANSPEFEAEIPYWQQQLNPVGTASLPRDLPPIAGANGLELGQSLQIWLDKPTTSALLHKVPAAAQIRVHELLLTGLGQVLCQWSGSSAVLVDLEGHGRADLFESVGVDLSQTVGWFTTVYPLRLECGKTSDTTALRQVKEQVRQLPQQGLGYGLLRYLRQTETTLAQTKPQVSFNYLGQRESGLLGDGRLFKNIVSEAEEWLVAGDQGGTGSRSHTLAINSQISGGRLVFDIEYSRAMYRPEVIGELAENLKVRLETLIEYCQQDQTPLYTPSDFTDVELSQSELDDLMNYLK